MRFVPVDTSRVELIYVESVPKMARDQKTGISAQKIHNDGRPVWAVRCLAREVGSTVPENAKPELIEVAVPNPRALAEVLDPFQPISFDNLRTFAWAMGQDGGGVNQGLAWSADGCKTIKAKTNGIKPEPVATGAAA